MEPNHTTKRIVLQREEDISIKQDILERYQEKVKYLENIIEQKKEDLDSFKKTLEEPL